MEDAQKRLLKSKIYDTKHTYKIFICNNLNTFRFFSSYEFKQAGAVSFPHLCTNSFMRKSNIENNRLIGPNGYEVRGKRTLAYFIAHEVTHTIVGRKIGGIAYLRLPKWIREGYSEYIAEDNLNEVPMFYYEDYLRVLNLLDIKKVSTEELLSGRIE